MQITITPSPDLRKSKKHRRLDQVLDKLKLAVSQKSGRSGAQPAGPRPAPALNTRLPFGQQKLRPRHPLRSAYRPADLATLEELHSKGLKLKSRLELEIAGVKIQLERELAPAAKEAGTAHLNSLLDRQQELEANLKKLDGQIKLIRKTPA